MHRIVPIAFSLTALLCCQQGEISDSSHGASPVVARFGALAITALDVDARILTLPPGERPKPGEDLDSWYEEQIRELAVEKHLRAQAAAENLAEDATLLAARRDAEKHLLVELCLDQLGVVAEEPNDEALRAAYEERSEDFTAPERRDVYHLFIRRAADESAAAARGEIEALRDRVLAGESFQRLAAEHSDSEGRHHEGALGWMTSGRLPAGFEEVIFALEEGVPSEPVATRDGEHLFYVDQILPARRGSFDEVRGALRARLRAERREAALEELEAQIELPTDALVLDYTSFVALVREAEDEAIILRIGETELTVGDLRRRLRQTLAQRPEHERPSATVELAWQLLEQLRRQASLYHHCRTSGSIPESEPELELRLAAWQGGALLALARQRRMLEVARRDEERLRLYYESNVGLFSTSPTWRLRRLRLFLDEAAGVTMARLEEAAAARSGPTLDELRAELGGEIDELGPATLAELRLREPKLPHLIAPLAVGRLSPPYRTESTLDIVVPLERTEAEPLPFAEVHERVAAAWVEQYTREAYRELADEILAGAELEIRPEGLATLRDGGLELPDPSVEELDALLSEL